MAPSIPSGNVANYMYFRAKPNLQETDDHEDFSHNVQYIWALLLCQKRSQGFGVRACILYYTRENAPNILISLLTCNLRSSINNQSTFELGFRQASDLL